MSSSVSPDWASGYVTEIGYTYGYYAELNPLRMAWPLLRAGLAVPAVENACELAFGQGVSLNLHAAASSTAWWGNDFNPAQAAFAQSMATAAGVGARVSDESFAEFQARTDLPEFDFIGLHGIYSWVTAENRQHIIDFVRRRLRPGGVVYISYNTAAGWASMLPARRLMAEHAAVMGAPGQGVTTRINGTLDFMQRLVAAEPLYAKANPQLAARLEQLVTHDRHYLAHEYFNREWRPVNFCDLAEELGAAKLGFGVSANPLEQIDALNLSAAQQELLASLPDAHFREMVRDFITNQQFRRDYWVKGACRLSVLEQGRQLRAQRFLLQAPRDAVNLKVKGARGEASLTDAVYGPILDLLGDHAPHTVEELESTVAGKGVKFTQVLEAVSVLMGKGDLTPVQSVQQAERALPSAHKVNRWLMERAPGGNAVDYLASPVTGGGVHVSRFEQMFLREYLGGVTESAAWAQKTWRALQLQGQRLVKEGKTLETAEENLAEVTRLAERFSGKQLPVLRTLGVV